MTIQALTLDIPPSTEREGVVRDLRGDPRPLMVLETCQRLEVYGPTDAELSALPVSRQIKNAFALERLARIAAGLESRILGELEVLGQVRSAYKDFRTRGGASDRHLDRFFQEALSLARKARKISGIDRQMTSLGGLACREILAAVPPGEPIAVIGSGSIASSVIRHLGKRGKCPVRVSSRCPENAARLALTVGGFAAGLQDLSQLLDGVGGIVSATAAPHPVVYPEHVAGAHRPLHVVDLGVPADCCDRVIADPSVAYTGLEEVERRANGNTEERLRRAEIAAEIIRDGATLWAARQ